MSARARSPIEALIDRACGVPEGPGTDDKALVVRMATVIACDVADFLGGFLGNPKGFALAKQAAVDFIIFEIEQRIGARS